MALYILILSQHYWLLPLQSSRGKLLDVESWLGRVLFLKLSLQKSRRLSLFMNFAKRATWVFHQFPWLFRYTFSSNPYLWVVNHFKKEAKHFLISVNSWLEILLCFSSCLTDWTTLIKWMASIIPTPLHLCLPISRGRKGDEETSLFDHLQTKH